MKFYKQYSTKTRLYIVTEYLNEGDLFEYTKKNSRETGTAVIGIELKSKEDLPPLIQKMKDRHFFGEYLNDKADLLNLLV